MKIRPWFLATVSLSFVALLVLVRGKSSSPAASQILARPAPVVATPNRKRAASRKVRVKDRIPKLIAASNLTMKDITAPIKGAVKKASAKVNQTRRSSRVKTIA